MPQHVVTVAEVLDGHTALNIECLDRIYLNAYVPKLQTSAQVVAFLEQHLGYPFPSPVLFKKLGDRFRKAVAAFAETNDIPWVKFGKDDVGGKLDLMRPHLQRQAATGRSGVAAIGTAQEFQRVWTATEGKTSTGTSRWSFYKTDRRVSCYYFYLWDADFGPAFIKVCTYFPYPAKVWLNGHEAMACSTQIRFEDWAFRCCSQLASSSGGASLAGFFGGAVGWSGKSRARPVYPESTSTLTSGWCRSRSSTPR